MINSAKKTYWAGFVERELGNPYLSDDKNEIIPVLVLSLFTRRKDAKLYFTDVRKVEIREVGSV